MVRCRDLGGSKVRTPAEWAMFGNSSVCGDLARGRSKRRARAQGKLHMCRGLGEQN